ncbi:pentapeptide repeat-containing protein [Thiobacillus sp.]|uniref:pentapeptide repeat-containing protein n=1 Tax=Thiobacillus sp. TaxID=924 RepID=UPI0025DB7364|nr:pentapeptide repeat-containing protein [Thiobacillus sp.]MBT9539896.1 pentapeptide repeat-containing protein [Thiobacillus sp.]
MDMSLIQGIISSHMKDLSPDSSPEAKIQFLDEDERVKKKQDFESRAEFFRREFIPTIQPRAESGGRPNKQDLVGIVDAQIVSDYCRKLGGLAEEASRYDWTHDEPKITAEFHRLRIEGSLRLAKARLPSLVFISSTISGEVDFTKARFLGQVVASYTDFLDDVYFNHAVISGVALLTDTKFSGNAYFSSTEFSSYADFPNSIFMGDAYFTDAAFTLGSNFTSSQFHNRGMFHRSILSGLSFLDEATFNGFADFEEAKFLGVTTFRKVSFLKGATFQGAVFSDNVDFSDSKFPDLANFEGAVFTRQARFLDCQFKKQTIFSRSRFALCPRFHEAVLHQDTSFTGARFDSMALTKRVQQMLASLPLVGRVLQKFQQTFSAGDTRVNWGGEARAYRTLKLLMSKHQAQHEASRFFAGEMRCRRREFGLKQPVHYFVSQLYDFFSEFGQSAGRVLFWMLLINAIFTFGYLIQEQQDTTAGQPRFAIVEQQGGSKATAQLPRWDREHTWLALSMQSFNPVAFLSPKNTWVQIYDGAVFTQGVSQSLMNLVLLILLAISLRGQFRRGSGGGD